MEPMATLSFWRCTNSVDTQIRTQISSGAFRSITLKLMDQASIKRVGVVVKPHQPDALQTLCRLAEWLNERGITLLGGPDIERERIEHETGCSVQVVEQNQLATSVDLMLVLGGDGTMIATARMVGDADVPVMGVNYGGLGYLAEFC